MLTISRLKREGIFRSRFFCVLTSIHIPISENPTYKRDLTPFGNKDLSPNTVLVLINKFGPITLVSRIENRERMTKGLQKDGIPKG